MKKASRTRSSSVCSPEAATVISRPPARQHREGPCEGFTADGVEDDVDVARHLLEALRAVVDDLVGAEIADQPEVVRRCGRDHVRAEPVRELHGEEPDGARPAVDEHALAARQSSAIDQALPGGERGDRRSSRWRRDRSIEVSA
jgi:hypothetical protein